MSFKKVANILGTNVYVQHIEFNCTEYWHDVDGTKSLVLLMTANNEHSTITRHGGEMNDFLHCQISNHTFHHGVMRMIEGLTDITDDLWDEQKLGADPAFAKAVPSPFAGVVDLGTPTK